MSIHQHPSPETLAAFAAGMLDEGRSIVVATHVSLCPACRGTVTGFEQVGGAMLDEHPPSAMQDDALQRALARLERPDAVVVAPRPSMPNAEGLPAPLARYPLGPWRWIGLGVQWRTVDTPDDGGTRVFMLKAQPGTRFPHHRHSGPEWTCVLQGAFRHDHGRYGPGDFDEADESIEHKPVVEDGDPCVCVVALQGRIELQGWLGRMLQPLVRI